MKVFSNLSIKGRVLYTGSTVSKLSAVLMTRHGGLIKGEKDNRGQCERNERKVGSVVFCG